LRIHNQSANQSLYPQYIHQSINQYQLEIKTDDREVQCSKRLSYM